MEYIIYLALCGLHGFICGRRDIKIKSLDFWVLTGCVIGAYLCGKWV